jgi:hypothetical protein
MRGSRDSFTCISGARRLNLNVEMKSTTHMSVKSFNREKIQSDCQNGGRGAPRNRTAILSSKLTRKLALSQAQNGGQRSR